MKDFEYFFQAGDVRKVSVNMALAESLIGDMKERVASSFKMSSSDFPKSVFENVYDALRSFCDALLALEGYKSYSHEASIAFLFKKGFDVAFVSQLDGFRYKRNGSKYYGIKIFKEDAEEIKYFYEENSKKIYKLLEGVDLL